MPVTPKYSLGTKLTVTPWKTSSQQQQPFDGYFRRTTNEQQATNSPLAYGLLTWSSVESATNKDYNLTLTRVYICSSSASGSDYTPLYDPDGTLFNRGAQFGCARDHPSLRYRFLLLDRTASETTTPPKAQSTKKPNNTTTISSFNAEFVDTRQVVGTISDGFRFNTSALFDLSSSGDDSVWYVHVFFVIRPTTTSSSSSSSNNNKNAVFNNGTNMQIIRLTSSSSSSSSASRPQSGHYKQKVKGLYNGSGQRQRGREGAMRKNYGEDGENALQAAVSTYSDYFVRIIMPIVVGLVLVIFGLSTLVYCKREQIHQFLFVGTGGLSRRREKANHHGNNNHQSINSRSLDLLNYAKTKLKSTNRAGDLTSAGNEDDDAVNNNDESLPATADPNDPINTSGNFSGSNSTSDTMVVVTGHHQQNPNNQQQSGLSSPQSPQANKNASQNNQEVSPIGANLTLQSNMNNSVVSSSIVMSNNKQSVMKSNERKTSSHQHEKIREDEDGKVADDEMSRRRAGRQDDIDDDNDEDEDEDEQEEESGFGEKRRRNKKPSFVSLRGLLSRFTSRLRD